MESQIGHVLTVREVLTILIDAYLRTAAFAAAQNIGIMLYDMTTYHTVTISCNYGNAIPWPWIKTP